MTYRSRPSYSVIISVTTINHSCLSLMVCMVLLEHLGIDCSEEIFYEWSKADAYCLHLY
jgi:hypothetical protein